MKTSLFTLLSAAIVAGCSASPARSDAEDKAALDRIRREFQQAERDGDAVKMYSYIAADIVVMPPNMPARRGEEISVASLREFFDTFKVDGEYKSEEIVIAGDWAFDRGTGTETLTPKNGAPPIVTRQANYVWIYRRDGDTWKQARVIWNSADPR
jgi:ketosteroid isomerase-like protein